MVNEELVSFILRSRERGRSDDQISRALLSVGWRRDRVEAAFKKIKDIEEDSSTFKDMGEAYRQIPEGAPGEEKEAASKKGIEDKEKAASKESSGVGKAGKSQPPETEKEVKSKLFSIPKLIRPKSLGGDGKAKPPSDEKRLESTSILSSLLQKRKSLTGLLRGKRPAAEEYDEGEESGGEPGSEEDFSGKNIPTIQTEEYAKKGKESELGDSSNPAFSRVHSSKEKGIFSKNIVPILAVLVLLAVAAGVYFVYNTYVLPTASVEEVSVQDLPLGQDSVEGALPADSEAADALAGEPNLEEPSDGILPDEALEGEGGLQEVPEDVAGQQSIGVNFYSSESLSPANFCIGVEGSFRRAHYIQYEGIGCSGEGLSEGFSSPLAFAKRCAEIPCCFSEPSGDFSYGYDYFECASGD